MRNPPTIHYSPSPHRPHTDLCPTAASLAASASVHPAVLCILPPGRESTHARAPPLRTRGALRPPGGPGLCGSPAIQWAVRSVGRERIGNDQSLEGIAGTLEIRKSKRRAVAGSLSDPSRGSYAAFFSPFRVVCKLLSAFYGVI